MGGSAASPLLPRLLVLLVLVWTSNKLLVLLSLLVNSLKLRRLALELDCRFSVWLRCRGGGEPGPRLDSESSPSAVEGEEAMMVASCGWECVL